MAMEHFRQQRITAMSTIMDIEIKQGSDGILVGALNCKYFDEPFIFTEITDMIEMMEIIFDTKGFPERQLLPRSFSKAKGRVKKNELDLSKIAKERSTVTVVTVGDGTILSPGGDEIVPSPTVTPTVTVCNLELSVRFRNKAEWQGSLLWREKGITSSFASIVELSRLINEALAM